MSTLDCGSFLSLQSDSCVEVGELKHFQTIGKDENPLIQSHLKYLSPRQELTHYSLCFSGKWEESQKGGGWKEPKFFSTELSYEGCRSKKVLWYNFIVKTQYFLPSNQPLRKKKEKEKKGGFSLTYHELCLVLVVGTKSQQVQARPRDRQFTKCLSCRRN